MGRIRRIRRASPPCARGRRRQVAVVGEGAPGLGDGGGRGDDQDGRSGGGAAGGGAAGGGGAGGGGGGGARGRGDGRARRAAQQQALLAGQAVDGGDGLAVGDRLPPVHYGGVEGLRPGVGHGVRVMPVPDRLDGVRAAVPAAVDGRRRVGADDLHPAG